MLIFFVKLVIIVILGSNSVIANNSYKDDKDCNAYANCRTCVEQKCSWCYIEYGQSLCTSNNSSAACSRRESAVNEFTALKNDDFTSYKDHEIVQMRPQKFNITLSPNIPMNISFSYKAAADYPLQMYYLMDSTLSMKNHMSLFKNIKKQLSKLLYELNIEIAHGTFMDKVAMPFSNMSSIDLKTHCPMLNNKSQDKCIPGYLFEHKMNFSKDIKKFVNKVKRTELVANLDDVDGGLDAIMQLLVCDTIIPWSKNARKIIFVATESKLHFAGDGILAGIPSYNNKNECLLNKKGKYGKPLLYDYPTFEQISYLLNKHKVNIIFASSGDHLVEYYSKLKQDLFNNTVNVIKFEETASNLLGLIGGLIKKTQDDLRKQVHFFINTAEFEHIEAKLYADCEETGQFKENGSCYNVKEGIEYKFIAQFTLINTPKILKQDRTTIKEQNLYEHIDVIINYQGTCKCANKSSDSNKPKIECKNGEYECGVCTCHEGWQGETCNKNCNAGQIRKGCLKDIDNPICQSRGYCECGKCICNPGSAGQYCEYQCAINTKTKKTCGSGNCTKFNCDCPKGFTGVACECSNSLCIAENEFKICSGNGFCDCDECRCNSSFYTGVYCEKIQPSFCDTTTPQVIHFLKTKEAFQENVTVSLETEVPSDFVLACLIVYQNATDFRCSTTYYLYNETSIKIKPPNCEAGTNISSVGIFSAIGLAIVVVGAIISIIYKCRNDYYDKQEFEKLLKNELHLKNHLGSNPLYKDPLTRFVNPRYNKDFDN